MPTRQPERQLTEFIAKFTPEMGKLIRAARSKMRSLMPETQSFLSQPKRKASVYAFFRAQGCRTRTNYCEATAMSCATFTLSPQMGLTTRMFVS
jgi:hypothetical protein